MFHGYNSFGLGQLYNLIKVQLAVVTISYGLRDQQI